jgi:hypothetical protein
MLDTPTPTRSPSEDDFLLLVVNATALSDSGFESSTRVFDSQSGSPRGQLGSATAVNRVDAHEWRRRGCFITTSSHVVESEGGTADLRSQDDLGDVAGVVGAVEALEETRLAKDNHEFVREMAVLPLPIELMLALVLARSGAAQHAAHDVS